MRIAFIVNEKRFDETLSQEAVSAAALPFQIEAQVCVLKPHDMIDFIKHSVEQDRYDLYVAVGGDGTARNVAQVLVGHDIPMAILPRGTFNYFAKELGYTDSLVELLQMIHLNHITTVDVGQVNDMIFINHAAVGFYSRVLKLKKKHQNWLGKNKLLKVIFSSLHIWRYVPIYRLNLEVDNLKITQETCLLFIGNNYHFSNLLDFGDRLSLTSGYLSVYILKCRTRWQLFKCMLSILFNTFDRKKYLRQFKTTEIKIDAASTHINIVVDGELMKLTTPLNFQLLHHQLKVVTDDKNNSSV